MNRSLAVRTLTLLAAFLVTPWGVIGAETGESQTPHSSKIVQSFYDLPHTVAVMKKFPASTGAVVKQFQERGIMVKPLPGKTPEHSYGFVGPSLVAVKSLHGTLDAPFSGSMFTVQHPAGISMTFKEPQAMVAMTITGPTTDTDVDIDLLFFDEKGQLIRKISADTRHDKTLDFDSRGAVFRGLKTPKASISSVHIVPTRVPENTKIVFADIDYFCFSATPEDESSASTVMDLVAQLGHSQYRVREDATRKLESLSPDHLAVLKSIETVDDPEVGCRLVRAIKALESKKVHLTADGKSE